MLFVEVLCMYFCMDSLYGIVLNPRFCQKFSENLGKFQSHFFIKLTSLTSNTGLYDSHKCVIVGANFAGYGEAGPPQKTSTLTADPWGTGKLNFHEHGVLFTCVSLATKWALKNIQETLIGSLRKL
jgi:hypothetical protein